MITGASSGIGAAIAKIFKKNKYPLLLLARRERKLTRFKSRHVLCKKVDVSDLNALRKAIQEAEEKFGPVGCIVNNAAVLYLGLFHEQNPKEWKHTFDVNILGVAYGMHVVLPGMIRRRKGTIFNICSVAGYAAYPAQAAYCASKFAVRAMTDSVRKEISKYNIRVMSVSPGAVETEVGKQTTSKKLKAEFDQMRKWVGPLEPETIAQAVFYTYLQPEHVCFREMIIAPTPIVREE